MDYFMNESESDVVFVIEGQRLPAEKRFLSIRNKVFRAMFSDNFKESKDKEVVVENTTFEAFKTLLQFIYTDQLVLKDKNDFKLIDEVYKLSDRYESIKLFDNLVEHMKTIILSLDNIELVSRIADRSENNELIDNVMTFIDNNLKVFGEDIKCLSLSESTHNYLLNCLIKHRIIVKNLSESNHLIQNWEIP